MKKTYMYLTSFLILTVLLSGCYFLSYKAALKEFNDNATQKNQELLAKLEQTKNEELAQVDSISKDVVTPQTKYTLELYNVSDHSFKEDEYSTPEFLIGLKREEIIRYLSEYMQDIPIEEYDQGLIAYELISFSKNEVVLRKTYRPVEREYQYYMGIINGFVTVFYSDKKTVYEYTQINAEELTEDERGKLIDGIEIKNQEELYGILENYSS